MAATSSIAGFFKLPGELRNHIYDLAFAFDDSPTISLVEATPPSKALVLANRRIYNESRLIYRDAFRRFWKTGHFIVDTGTEAEVKSARERIKRLDVDSMQQIQDLEIRIKIQSTYFDALMSTFNLVDSKGVWYRQSFGDGRRYYRYHLTWTGYCLSHHNQMGGQAQAGAIGVGPPPSVKAQVLHLLSYFGDH